MESFLESIVSGISPRGREAVEHRRRLRSAQQPFSFYYEEPTIAITPVLPVTPVDYDVNYVDSLRREEGGDWNTLQSLARRSEWSALARRCHSHPSEASSNFVDSRTGDTVLHWVVTRNPPSTVAKALVAGDSELVNVFNHFGKLPLHMACSHRASAEVIQELVQADPRTAIVRDGAGFCPLHILCDRGGSVSSLLAVLQTAEGVASIVVEDCIFGRTPLHILDQRKNLTMFTSCVETLRSLRKRERDAKFFGNWNESDRRKLSNRMRDAKEMDFWGKARLLILAEYALSSTPIPKNASYSLDDSKNNGIVQACLGVGDCPLSLLEYALLVYNEELLVKNRDGKLPLHQACASLKAPNEKEKIIAEVLWAEPKAAMVRSGDGALALELFLKSSLEPPSWSETLQSLISANPLALEAIDFDVRLYPMLLSRMGRTDKARSNIFNILRGNPALCSSSNS